MQYTSHHHHHLVARSKSIAVSTMRRQEGRSVARRNAEYGSRPERLHSEADQGTTTQMVAKGGPRFLCGHRPSVLPAFGQQPARDIPC